MNLLSNLRVALFAALLVPPAQRVAAADAVGIPDLQAAMRALGFLDSLPQDGTIFVGVVYGPSIPDGRAAAEQIVGELNAMEGPGSKVLHAEAIPLENLSQAQGRLDVLRGQALLGDAGQIQLSPTPSAPTFPRCSR